MEKSEVIQKIICTFLWSENIRFYIFTSENIKYTIYINNIFLYFTTLYIINTCTQMKTSFYHVPLLNIQGFAFRGHGRESQLSSGSLGKQVCVKFLNKLRDISFDIETRNVLLFYRVLRIFSNT